MWLLSGFQLIGESPSASEWLRRSVYFRSAQQRTHRHAKSRGCLTFWQLLVFQYAVPALPATPSPTCKGRSFRMFASSVRGQCESESTGTPCLPASRDDRHVRLDFDSILLCAQRCRQPGNCLNILKNKSISHLKQYASAISSSGISSRSLITPALRSAAVRGFSSMTSYTELSRTRQT